MSSTSCKRPSWTPILMATWNRAQSLGVTEPTLNAASVAPHQLKNDTVPIMTWWLLCMSFNVDIVMSAQHHLACNKTKIKLSLLGSVSSKLSRDYIFLQGPRGNPVSEYHKSPSPISGVCQDSFHANAVDTMLLCSQGPWSKRYCKSLYCNSLYS